MVASAEDIRLEHIPLSTILEQTNEIFQQNCFSKMKVIWNKLHLYYEAFSNQLNIF